MKRLAQFVVLIAVVLLAAQPASGYLFCSQGSCSGFACPLVCCGDMPGMGNASMHSGMDCSAMMEALPAAAGCGQPLGSVAAITRDAVVAGAAAGDDRTAVFLSQPALAPPVSACTGGGASPLALTRRGPIDRGVLFQVFRI
jgi:hypothetical protein